MAADLFPKPAYFAERVNAGGAVRYYWKASQRLAPLLLGSLQPWSKGIVRLADDRATAAGECERITAAVKAYLNQALGRSEASPEAAHGAASAPAARFVLRQSAGTLSHAIATYKQSQRYRDNEPATQKQYDWILGVIEDWAGHRRLASLSLAIVGEAAARLEGNPRKQQLFLQLLAMVIDRDTLGRALAKGEVVPNPARYLLRDLKAPEAEGGWIWPRWAVPYFTRAADLLGYPSVGTAITLNEWLAQRTGDILEQPRQLYRDGVLHVVQSKTDQYVPLPLAANAALAARLEWQFAHETRSTIQSFRPATLLICEDTRAAWKKDWFRSVFHRIRSAVAGADDARAGDLDLLAGNGMHPIGALVLDAVPKRMWRQMRSGALGTPAVPTASLWFAHLRHTGITRMHQAGCSDEEICSVSGHTKPATVYKHYRAVTIERARSAFDRRLAFEAGR